MGTGSRWTKVGVALLLSTAFLCVEAPSFARAETAQRQKKSKKQQPQLPPLPSGPTGPVQQIPLDSIAAVPPQVTYQDNQLTIIAPNSTLADILRAVRRQTGAEIEIPAAPERVVTRLGPGPARDVVAELLNGSRFNYVLLGSEGNDAALTRVVLVAKAGPQTVVEEAQTNSEATRALLPGVPHTNEQNQQQQDEAQADANEAESAEDTNPDDNGDQQAADADQQQAPPQEQQGVKTPQQMLQEMQQRQLQLQNQQPPGQPPVPGSGMPPHPPQEN